MTLNASVRNWLGKTKGAIVKVQMEVDPAPVPLSPELLECLADEPPKHSYFNKLPGSHQQYYSKWIESAKTEVTKAKRIARTVAACERGMSFGEMMRSYKNENNILLR